jgi:hypothetical protein
MIYALMIVADGEVEHFGLFETQEKAEAAVLAFAQEVAHEREDAIPQNADEAEDYLVSEDFDWWVRGGEVQ